ncbi:MAG: glucose-1-phosphate adenylyltransferase [Planctomycetaceae bacterium]
MLSKTLAIILAGGVGSRLHPLTQERAKPAVPFGGKYRIIDFTLSNCYHSGLRRILVLTQYKSHSLQKHLRDGWSIYNPSLGEYITPVPPQMRTGESWYTGTADAVYQNLYLLERSEADQVIILSGDHIYRMDYAAMLRFHCDSLADATVACMQVPIEEASAFGVMQIDENMRIVDFEEKPASPRSVPGHPGESMVSMGIYIFSRSLLCDLLKEDHLRENSSHDFGKDIFGRLISSHDVYAYRFGGREGRVTTDGYWRDVGTVDAYYQANMDLLKTPPPLDLYQRDWLIRTVEGQGPPARVVAGESGRRPEFENSMLNSGTIVTGGSVVRSILGRNVRVDEGAVVTDCLLENGVRIGAGARLSNCIVDKHVNVPAGEIIGLDPVSDRRRFTVSEQGVVVIPKSYQFAATHSAGDSSVRPIAASGS